MEKKDYATVNREVYALFFVQYVKKYAIMKNHIIMKRKIKKPRIKTEAKSEKRKKNGSE